MKEFPKDLEQLPEDRQKAIIEGIGKQILSQAIFVRDEQPTKFSGYIENEIRKANESMFKMVEESGRDGAELQAISEIYIWNKERKKALERLRNEFLQNAPEPQYIQQEFDTEQARSLFSRAIDKGLVEVDGKKFKWIGTKSLYGYFVDKTSDFLNIRHSNNRIPWRKYEAIISNHSELLATARQAVNDYTNKELPPPEGDDKVDDICK